MPVVTEDQPTPQRRRGRYPKEFRTDAAALVIDQKRTVADVAKELGIVEQTLGNWVRQERIDRGEREEPAFDRMVLVDDRGRQIVHGLIDEAEQHELHDRQHERQPERSRVANDVQELLAKHGQERAPHG